MKLNQSILDNFVTDLKNVKYRGLIQQLKLEYCTDEFGIDYIYLVLIVVKKSKKGNGYGGLILTDIINLSNKYSTEIRLWATHIYGSDINKLCQFYKKYGFVDKHNFVDNHMVYKPLKIK